VSKAACVQQHAYNSMRTAACVQHAYSSMRTAACVQQHEYSSMRTAACVQQHAYSSIRTAACVQQHAYSSMRTAACVQQHAYSSMSTAAYAPVYERARRFRWIPSWSVSAAVVYGWCSHSPCQIRPPPRDSPAAPTAPAPAHCRHILGECRVRAE
jgi:hypothetical protein